jgi:carboxyl-terminal processing protease
MNRKNLIIAVALVATIFVVGFNRDTRNFEITKNLDIYHSLFRELDLFYVDSIQPEKLIRSSIDDMLEGLDPYTVYIPEDDMEDFKFMTTGEYGGIGSLISQRDGFVMISDPYEGLPAAKAGLKAGDLLIEIEGKKLKDKTVSEVSDMLKGTPGTTFTLKVKQGGTEKIVEKQLTREKITINPVAYAGIIDGDIGYIRLSGFTDKASVETEKALKDLMAQGAKSIVLDVRSNPGGILDEAVNIVNLFVGKGNEIVSTKGKVKQWDKVYKTTREPIAADIPLVVLVNSGSASASEIVAGAIQDLDRGVVIGTRTFGKGLVQTTRNLSYNGKLKITTAKYYIPSGRCIQALDYSHRNEDGSVGRVPDSLISEFKTKNGRLVKDGGGVMPDVSVDFDRPGNVTIALVRNYLIFDYATEFSTMNPKISPASDFKITDDDYKAFKEYVKGKDFEYTIKSEELLVDLKKMLKAEGYGDMASKELLALESVIKHDVDKDLDAFRTEISELLSQEICKRYYFQRGEVEVALNSDVVITKAKEVIRSGKDYRKILAFAD